MSKIEIELTEGWAIDELDDLVEILVSNVDKKTAENEPAVRLCNYMDVYSNEYITSKIDFMNATASKSQISKFSIKEGDVMITKDSETPDDIGIASVSLEDFNDVVCGYHLALLKPKKDKIIGKFLAKQLGQYQVNRQFANRANGSTRYGLTLNVIETALIPYPISIDKQHKIAHILTTFDTVIEQTQSAITKYKAIKQGLLHDLFTRGLDTNGHLRPSYHDAPEMYKESELGMIPKEWESCKMGKYILNNLYGPRFDAKDYAENGNVKTIRGTDFTKEGEILYEQAPKALLPIILINAHKLNDGDIVMVTTANCGLTAVFKKPFNDVDFIPSAYSVKYRFASNVNPYFIKYFMNTDKAIRQVNKFVRQGTLGNLPGSDVLRFDMIYPDKIEQDKIVNRLFSLDNKIQTEETLLQKYQSIKRGLMGDLLGGRKEV